LAAIHEKIVMSAEGCKILLTGLPGCGKTTAVMGVLERLRGVKAAGFYTEEIREGGKRLGFGWRSLEGEGGVLAHVDISGKFRVGRYGVNVSEFERKVVPILDAGRENVDLFVVDEIGKMECFSRKFVEAVGEVLSSEKMLLASVALKGGGFIRAVKEGKGVRLFELRRERFEEIVTEVSEILSGVE
jgi:nucleoside-triphosphatase